MVARDERECGGEVSARHGVVLDHEDVRGAVGKGSREALAIRVPGASESRERVGDDLGVERREKREEVRDQSRSVGVMLNFRRDRYHELMCVERN